MHIGHAGCAEDHLRDYIGKINADPLGYVIGMGDYADCVLKDDKRFQSGGLAPWVEHDNIIPTQQQHIIELLTPIKGKILCLLTGNHEETIHDRYQYNITLELCRALDVPYGGYACFIDLFFSRAAAIDLKRHGTSHNYRIHAWHGSGAAQTEGARLMRLMRLVNDVEADIYLMGHLHAITQHTPDRLVCRNGKVKAMRLAATITGSWLKTYTQSNDTNHPIPPSYGEKAGYKPSRLGAPIIHICPDKDWFTVEA